MGAEGERFEQLFNESQGKSWVSLENCVALIEAENFRLVDAKVAHRRSLEATILYVPCAPIIARLRSALTATEVEQVQGHLQFPLTSVAVQPERRGKRA